MTIAERFYKYEEYPGEKIVIINGEKFLVIIGFRYSLYEMYDIAKPEDNAYFIMNGRNNQRFIYSSKYGFLKMDEDGNVSEAFPSDFNSMEQIVCSTWTALRPVEWQKIFRQYTGSTIDLNTGEISKI